MADNNYFEHQMVAASILTVEYWVEGSTQSRKHTVAMVGSCNSFSKPEAIEALVLSETGALLPITQYMRNIEARMFKIISIAQPPERTR